MDPRGFSSGLINLRHKPEEDAMKLSARNQFQGTVSRITEGQAMAEVAVKVGNLECIAAITEGSVTLRSRSAAASVGPT